MKKIILILASAFVLLITSNIFAKGWVTVDGNWKYELSDGEYAADQIVKSGNDSYYVDENGFMVRDYLYQNDDKYYFDENGKMVKETWVGINPEAMEDTDLEYDVYYFYFGPNGKAIKGDEGKKKEIDGKSYFFNPEGIMLTGWISKSGEALDFEDSDDWYGEEAKYYAHDDGTLYSGWLAWTDGLVDEKITDIKGEERDISTMYFYFNPTNYEKVEGKEKTINGKKYSFCKDNGRMMTEWELLESNYSGVDQDITVNTSKNKYMNSTDDGSMAKKAWIYAVPSAVIDSEKHDDEEEEWFYANKSGDLLVDQKKKINGKTYYFDKKGIMCKGLVILRDGKYYDRVDLEKTTSEDFIKKYRYTSKDDKAEHDDFMVMDLPNYNERKAVLYFNENGELETGKGFEVEFADGTLQYVGNNQGGYHGWRKNKIYENGMLCKATEDMKYGFALDTNTPSMGSVDVTVKFSLADDVINYNNALDAMLTDEQFMQMYAAYTGTSQYCDYTPALYKKHYPLGIAYFTEMLKPLGTPPPNPRAGLIGFVVDTKGNIKKKGVYKDGNENYIVVDEHKQYVGYFDVPVKWMKVNGVDIPHYKSDKKTVNSKGETNIKYDTWIPFCEKDAYGRTELDHVAHIPDEMLINCAHGSYNPM